MEKRLQIRAHIRTVFDWNLDPDTGCYFRFSEIFFVQEMTQKYFNHSLFLFVVYILLPLIQNYRFWDIESSLRQPRIKHNVLRKKTSYYIQITNHMEHSHPPKRNSFKDNQRFTSFFHIHTVYRDNCQSFFHQLIQNWIVFKTILNVH